MACVLTMPRQTYLLWKKNLIEPSALFPSPPHLTQASILWSNEQFYKVDYEDQICLSWPNLIAWQFSLQWDNENSSFDYKKLQMGGGGRKKSRAFLYTMKLMLL